jgi:hypothetical protein
MQLINRGTTAIWCLYGRRLLVVLIKDRDLRPLVWEIVFEMREIGVLGAI